MYEENFKEVADFIYHRIDEIRHELQKNEIALGQVDKYELETEQAYDYREDIPEAVGYKIDLSFYMDLAGYYDPEKIKLVADTIKKVFDKFKVDVEVTATFRVKVKGEYPTYS